MLPDILHLETRKSREEQELCSQSNQSSATLKQDVEIVTVKGNISDSSCHNTVTVPSLAWGNVLYLFDTAAKFTTNKCT